MSNFIDNQGVFLVVEVAANHGQDFARAVAMIKKAKECGVDAIKFQAYMPDTLTRDKATSII
jgi:sialic acid synthase SpsE